MHSFWHPSQNILFTYYGKVMLNKCHNIICNTNFDWLSQFSAHTHNLFIRPDDR